MKLSKFSCRDPERDEPEEAVDVEALDAEQAAEEFAELVYGGTDHFDSISVEVRDSEGKVTTWTVEVEYEPVFRAAPDVSS